VNTWKAILAVLVIFGAGFVTGHVATRLSEAAKPAPAPAVANALHAGTRSGQPPLSLEQLRKVELMGRVQKDLDLTPEQHVRIEKIIEDSQGRIRDLWDQVAPDIHDEYDDVQKKVCQELTPDQKKTFDDLMKKQQHLKKPAPTNTPPQALEKESCTNMCSITPRHPAS
jgi:Spy/CpxP family protein refolding chaperone